MSNVAFEMELPPGSSTETVFVPSTTLVPVHIRGTRPDHSCFARRVSRILIDTHRAVWSLNHRGLPLKASAGERGGDGNQIICGINGGTWCLADDITDNPGRIRAVRTPDFLSQQ